MSRASKVCIMSLSIHATAVMAMNEMQKCSEYSVHFIKTLESLSHVTLV